MAELLQLHGRGAEDEGWGGRRCSDLKGKEEEDVGRPRSDQKWGEEEED